MSAHPLDARLAELLLTRDTFTADDLTERGTITLDATHAPNARQNGIGSYVQQAARHGLIVWTGDVVRSRAPHRKGGAVRVWSGTHAGRRWAHTITSNGGQT